MAHPRVCQVLFEAQLKPASFWAGARVELSGKERMPTRWPCAVGDAAMPFAELVALRGLGLGHDDEDLARELWNTLPLADRPFGLPGGPDTEIRPDHRPGVLHLRMLRAPRYAIGRIALDGSRTWDEILAALRECLLPHGMVPVGDARSLSALFLNGALHNATCAPDERPRGVLYFPAAASPERAIPSAPDGEQRRELFVDRLCPEAQNFLGSFNTSRVDFKPSTGIGMFNASVCGPDRTVRIQVKVRFQFRDGEEGDTADSDAQWGPGTDEQEAFKAAYLEEVAAAWSNQYALVNTAPGWKGVRLRVQVEAIEKTSDGKYFAADYVVLVGKHLHKTMLERPSVVRPGHHHDLKRRNEGGVAPAVPNTRGDAGLLFGQLQAGTADIQSADVWEFSHTNHQRDEAVSLLFVPRQQRPAPHAESDFGRAVNKLRRNGCLCATVVGHASLLEVAPPGIEPTQLYDAEQNSPYMDAAFALALARAQGVQADLLARGISTRRVMVDADMPSDTLDPRNSRVDIVLTADAQNTASHEFGHMLGLHDEYREMVYADDPRYQVIDPAYAAMCWKTTRERPRRSDDNVNMMATGRKVERWHYSSIVEAVRSITRHEGWTVEGATEDASASTPPFGKRFFEVR